MKDDEMDEACSMHRKDKNFVQNVCRKFWKEEYALEAEGTLVLKDSVWQYELVG
jgi:hypothetical protein